MEIPRTSFAGALQHSYCSGSRWQIGEPDYVCLWRREFEQLSSWRMGQYWSTVPVDIRCRFWLGRTYFRSRGVQSERWRGAIAGGETGSGAIARGVGAGVGARVTDCGAGWVTAGLGSERSRGTLSRRVKQIALTARRTRNTAKSNLGADSLVGSRGLRPRIRGRLGGARSSALASGGNTESKPGW